MIFPVDYNGREKMESIKVVGLGKAYKQYSSRWARLVEWVIPFCKKRHALKWVLKDVDFSVNAGESIGVIGINGAGKSTLLKMITGTTQPTAGYIEFSGSVAALLELGMGFHPDFTGRQNVYMAGQLLGYNVKTIASLMSEIENFAGIGDYIDSPIRVYSSGMQVRLAFAVATAIRPDILIVDEALSVGDVLFQQKCIQKIREFKAMGTSIIFVTHDISALHQICDRAIVLSEGGCVFQGRTNLAVEVYFSCLARQNNTSKFSLKDEDSFSFDLVNRYIDRSGFLNVYGVPVESINENEDVTIQIYLKNLCGIEDPHVGIRIQDRLGSVVYESNTYCHKFFLENYVDQDGCAVLNIKFKNNLSRGEYTLAFGIEQKSHGDGLFENVICVTQIVKSFVVVRPPSSENWAGSTNITPQFFSN